MLNLFSFLGACRRTSSLFLKNENLATIILGFVQTLSLLRSRSNAWVWFSGSSEWPPHSLDHRVQGCHWRQGYHALTLTLSPPLISLGLHSAFPCVHCFRQLVSYLMSVLSLCREFKIEIFVYIIKYITHSFCVIFHIRHCFLYRVYF